MAYGFYIASVCGALALWLMLPSSRGRPAMLGALAAAATLGGLLLHTGHLAQVAGARTPGVYYYIFTVLAAAAAIRVITHRRPVYSALYFVLVVLSVAGMFLILEAEFMAFAMVIIYAGAILVTYLFVLMLATLPPSADDAESAADYDRVAREPLIACVIGFALLGVLASVIFAPSARIAPRPDVDALTAAVERMPGRVTGLLVERDLLDVDPAAPLNYRMEGHRLAVGVEGRTLQAIELTPDLRRAIADSMGNIDRVGLNLFETHTLGIELAGVILLLSMVGAIVIARRKVDVERAQGA